jgi:hypothetical protein
MDNFKFAGIINLDKLGEIGNEKPVEKEKEIPEDIGNRVESEQELPEDIGNVIPAEKTKGEELDELINNINLKMNKNDLINLWEEVKPFTKNEGLLDNLARNNQDKAEDLKKILGIALSHERDYDPRYNVHVDSTMESIMKGLRGIYFSIENSLSKFKGKYASSEGDEKVLEYFTDFTTAVINFIRSGKILNDETNKGELTNIFNTNLNNYLSLLKGQYNKDNEIGSIKKVIKDYFKENFNNFFKNKKDYELILELIRII